jgi:RNA methyltransferase, TrmH family
VATITSRHHPLVKTFRHVARGDDARLALLDGWHLIDEALRAKLAIDTIAVIQDATDTRPLLSRAHDRNIPIVEVSSSVMDALSPVRTPSGVVALVERQTASIDAVLEQAPALILMAVDMQDPGNVGAIVRSAEAGGATAVAFAGASCDPWGWKALRASMGSTLRVPILQEKDPGRIAEALQAAGVQLFAAVPRGSQEIHRVDMSGSIAFMLGGEGTGLPATLLERASAQITIPMTPPVESLNAAVAAALLVYEARRQRHSG